MPWLHQTGGTFISRLPKSVLGVFTSRDLVGITFLKLFKFLLQMLYCSSFHKQVGVVKLLQKKFLVLAFLFVQA